ncbi:MAG TPA: CdaR family protein [Thermoanaerobaculia bacterium]|nr:CdaR family protein [Thermoanaerobaculia bacterium]
MSERASLWWLRLLALAIGVALWLTLSWGKRERQSERVVEASITYDTAEEMTVLDPVRQIDVRVRGGTQRVRTLNPAMVNVLVELDQTRPGGTPVQLTPENVYVPEGFEVVSLDPNTLNLTLDRLITKRLPVEVDLAGEPAAGATVGTPVAIPPAVSLRGPETRLENVRLVRTRPVSLTRRAQTFEEMASVLPPDPLVSVEPGLVRVRVPMEPPRLSTDAVPRREGS